MSRQHRSRPSALAGVSDPYAAYCLDEAVYIFGVYAENQLNEAEKGAKTDKQRANKRMMRLQTLLQEPEERPMTTKKNEAQEPNKKADLPPAKKAPTRFRDPAEIFKNKSKPIVKTGE